MWGRELGRNLENALRDYSRWLRISVERGGLTLLDGKWYVTHSGLLALANRRHCCGIDVAAVRELCDCEARRWAFKATVFKSLKCRGFVGYGDADPSNVSHLFYGAEMRIAETRAVNRALRKAYGIGICSVEELGATSSLQASSVENKRLAQPVNGNAWNSGPTVRDRLCQLIRKYQLDAALVKSYCTDFCGVNALREARREQLENFVQHLADWAKKDRNALLCQLNSYVGQKEGAA
jgi:hypothetical protein